MSDLERCGYIEKTPGKGDARRRPAQLTAEGRAFEAKVSERLRAHLAFAYRSGGLEAVGGARRILAAMAGSRLAIAAPDGEGE
jgi:DNA-binding MarR family transcriptional regulator